MSFNLASVRSLRLLAVALLLTVLVPACSVNPATGKQQLNLIPESQEIAMGQEADVGIVAQMGLYPDEGLQAYVQELGSRLAAKSERPLPSPSHPAHRRPRQAVHRAAARLPNCASSQGSGRRS